MSARRARGVSSLRSRWLGGRMRELREGRGLTLKYVADCLGVGFADVAAHEHGRHVLVFDRVAALLDLYGVYDGVEREHLLALARAVYRLPRWEDDFTGPTLDVSMLDYLWLESVATQVRCYGPVLVPELLRTSAYVEAVVRGEVRDVSDLQLGWWVRAFRDRQQVLDNGRAPTVRAVLAESVLYRPVGGVAGTLPGQLRHLAHVGSGGRMSARVLPAGAGFVPGADGWFTVFELPALYPSWAACTGRLGGLVIHEGAAAQQYAAVFDQLWDAALGTAESVALIAGLADGSPADSRS